MINSDIFDDDTSPHALEQFIKAVAANVRRYASDDSVLNKELAPGIADLMIELYLEWLWVYALHMPSDSSRLIDASLQGKWTETSCPKELFLVCYVTSYECCCERCRSQGPQTRIFRWPAGAARKLRV